MMTDTDKNFSRVCIREKPEQAGLSYLKDIIEVYGGENKCTLHGKVRI